MRNKVRSMPVEPMSRRGLRPILLMIAIVSKQAVIACAPEPMLVSSFFFQAEDGIRDPLVTGVQTCALPISTAMHPYMPNAGFDAVPHHAFRVSGRGHDQRTLSGWINLLDAGIAPLALQFGGDRKSVV